jgi:hypothetical protein
VVVVVVVVVMVLLLGEWRRLSFYQRDVEEKE